MVKVIVELDHQHRYPNHQNEFRQFDELLLEDGILYGIDSSGRREPVGRGVYPRIHIFAQVVWQVVGRNDNVPNNSRKVLVQTDSDDIRIAHWLSQRGQWWDEYDEPVRVLAWTELPRREGS